MADQLLSNAAALAIGGVVVKIGTALWTALTKTRSDQILALQAQIESKNETIAILKADVERLTNERDAVGAKHDAVLAQMTKERIQAAGVTMAIQQDPNISNEFAEAMPTAVRNIAELADPKAKKDSEDAAKQKAIDEMLERFTSGTPTPVPGRDGEG